MRASVNEKGLSRSRSPRTPIFCVYERLKRRTAVTRFAKAPSATVNSTPVRAWRIVPHLLLLSTNSLLRPMNGYSDHQLCLGHQRDEAALGGGDPGLPHHGAPAAMHRRRLAGDPGAERRRGDEVGLALDRRR